MKNEPGRRADKIVELLSESLLKQDQMMEIMTHQGKILSEHSSLLNRIISVLEGHTQILTEHNNKLVAIETKLNEQKEIKERISRLEKHTGLL